MKIFKYNVQSFPTILEQGEFINGIKSVMWVERYREPGEFQIGAQVSSGLREKLPEGTLISHVDTDEIMIVENHEIQEPKRSDPTIKITGRTFPSFLSNRIVGVNLSRSSSNLVEYVLSADETWDQAVKLINDHIRDATDTNDNVHDVEAKTYGALSSGTVEARSINRGDVLQELLSILAIDDLGIRTVRKSPWAAFYGGDNTKSYLVVYQGNDLSNQVSFSWQSGDLESTSYLFSNKNLKNSAMVLGRYVWTMYDVTPDTDTVAYNRRIMIVDASDLDGDLSAAPVGGALTTLLNKMAVRGRQALARQNQITISQTDISDLTKLRYRTDYRVGDLVTLSGNFGQSQVMRVVEFAEIEDENGVSGHPTLSIPGT